MSKVDWDKRYMDLARHYATFSKDKSTGVGAIIVTPDNSDILKGYNGFPRGADDDVEERHEKPTKYLWTEHAERNAIYKAAREGISTKDCKMYSNYFPCAPCARGITQAGIKTVIAPKPDLTHPKWGEDWATAIEIFEDCGVEIKYYSYE